MQITRHTSLSEPQFLGCTSAFVEVLSGELNAAAMYLRKLEGSTKGAAFAYEMSLDRHRYGALTVLDRWAELVRTFGVHVRLTRYPDIIDEGPARTSAAEEILARANQLIDSAESYTSDLVTACTLAFQALATTFAEERRAAAGWAARAHAAGGIPTGSRHLPAGPRGTLSTDSCFTTCTATIISCILLLRSNVTWG